MSNINAVETAEKERDAALGKLKAEKRRIEAVGKVHKEEVSYGKLYFMRSWQLKSL